MIPKRRSGERRPDKDGPAIVDVEASITIIGEASPEVWLFGELPGRVRLFSTDSNYPTGAEFHRHASEILLSDPTADTVRSLKNHNVLYAVLDQHLRRR